MNAHEKSRPRLTISNGQQMKREVENDKIASVCQLFRSDNLAVFHPFDLRRAF
ncbi:hypothetical protein Psta_1144 [Pirellula staleyi DSM 6068]|uniref:Uncharacterized protein n=1 Tax=Pirellula staleyi (strain ATCC 27377 / DSM 6068 / ICPB 4128) TaxID=530564 RepID=D2R8Z9_PIRSD|nr:hypothetical protein Psta_1144 [Pirellula staleyi DSM 6068]